MRRMATWRTRLAIGVVGTLVGLVAQAVQLQAGATAERSIITFAVGEAYILGGLFAWNRDPRNRTWPVMVGAGVGWFLGDFAASPVPVVRALGVTLADTDAILLIALVLAYPTGRLLSVAHRMTVGLAAVGLTAANVCALVTGDASVSLVLGLALTALMGMLVPRRWLRARPDDRRVLAPAVLAASITLLVIGIAIGIRLLEVPETVREVLLAIRDVAVLVIPIGFVVGSFELTQLELRRSRARLVEASDVERRRIERDLHDGAQQRLVTVSVALRLLRSKLDTAAQPDATRQLDEASEQLRLGIDEIRDLAQGIHPAVLTQSGLAGALPSLADRAAVPTSVVAVPEARLPPSIESTAYFVASEALTNVAKHAAASKAVITVAIERGRLRIDVRDDGIGGADLAAGSGLRGLADRVSAIGGELRTESRPGAGTTVSAWLPLPDDEAVPANSG